VWSPFYLATRGALCSVGGLLNISDHVMSKAVQKRYLKKEEARIEVHRQLLTFFEGAPEDLCPYERKITEIPYQMLHARESQRLQRFLLDIKHYLELTKIRPHDLHVFWRSVGEEPGTVPADLGHKYSASVDRYEKVLQSELEGKFADYDSRKEVGAKALEAATVCSQCGFC
jgi:hypothetical protein